MITSPPYSHRRDYPDVGKRKVLSVTENSLLSFLGRGDQEQGQAFDSAIFIVRVSLLPVKENQKCDAPTSTPKSQNRRPDDPVSVSFEPGFFL